MDTKKADKYADYKYVIQGDTELQEAQWLIEQWDFDDLDDYVDCARRAEIRIMKREDAEKKKRADARKKRRIEVSAKRRAA